MKETDPKMSTPKTYIFAAVLALTTATAQAQAPDLSLHQLPDGRWACPNGDIPSGDWRISCFGGAPRLSAEQGKAMAESWWRSHEAEAARQAEQSRQAKAKGREIILQTCTKPDPSINKAWCADQLAHLND
jgi:hypothetical protein